MAIPSKIPDKPWKQLSQKKQHILVLHEQGRLKWHYKNHYGGVIIFTLFKAIFGEKLLSRDRSIQKIEADITQ